jgi:hypothetical protein
MNLLQACYTHFINFLRTYNEIFWSLTKIPQTLLQISYKLLIVFLWPFSEDLTNFLSTC